MKHGKVRCQVPVPHCKRLQWGLNSGFCATALSYRHSVLALACYLSRLTLPTEREKYLHWAVVHWYRQIKCQSLIHSPHPPTAPVICSDYWPLSPLPSKGKDPGGGWMSLFRTHTRWAHVCKIPVVTVNEKNMFRWKLSSMSLNLIIGATTSY